MNTEEKVRQFIVEFYTQAKNTSDIEPLYEAPVKYIEEYLMDDEGGIVSGGKIIFDIQGLEANYIRYPKLYRKFYGGEYTNDFNDYTDAKLLHIFTTMIRKVIQIIKDGE